MEKKCSDCIIKLKMNWFNCEVERTCKSCLDQTSQKITYSTDINMLKRKHANDYHQMLPYYGGEYEPKTSTINFGINVGCEKSLLSAEKPMIEKRRFETIKNVIACSFYIKNEDNPENKVIFVYGFKQIRTDKVDIYIIIGCESDGLYENNKLFNFWSNKFIKEEIEKRKLKMTEWLLWH